MNTTLHDQPPALSLDVPGDALPLIMQPGNVRKIVGRSWPDLKRETRRTSGLDVVNRHPDQYRPSGRSRPDKGRPVWHFQNTGGAQQVPCRYGTAGSRFWVREKWGGIWRTDRFRQHGQPPSENGSGYDPVLLQYPDVPKEHRTQKRCRSLMYRSDYEEDDGEYCWANPLFMPKYASRLLLLATYVAPVRLHSITPAQAKAEGVTYDQFMYHTKGEPEADADGRPWVRAFFALWDRINGDKEGGLYRSERNPWVWRICFKVDAFAEAKRGEYEHEDTF